MRKFSPPSVLGRAGSSAALAALVALAGYGVGLSQSASSAAAASSTPVTAPAKPAVSAPAVTSYAGIVSAATPAVVTVRVDKRAAMVPTQIPDDPLLREFFGRRVPPRDVPRAPRRSGLGSGVITTADGYILTNNHVVEGAERVRVELSDRRAFDARVVGADPQSDLALLKVEATSLPTLPIGDSDRASVGDIVLAIGNPLGVGQTVTMGIISAKGRSTGLGDGSYEDFLQTDAPINEGNSGGALVNLEGELVGINSQILTPSGGNIGLGFAIPSNMARAVMDQLKTDGRVSRGKLGVTVQNVTADIAASLRLPDVAGALISGIEPNSAAGRAGLRQGDVVVGLDGERVTDTNNLRNRIAATKPGSSVSLEIVRDGKAQTLRATLDSLKAGAVESSDRGGRGAETGGFGMTVQPLTPQAARELELPSATGGVLVRDVDPDGAAAAAGLQRGDVITQVNGTAVSSPEELRSRLNGAGDRPALLLVARQDASLFVTLKPRS
jgi:Do/DeqQ family serine protease